MKEHRPRKYLVPFPRRTLLPFHPSPSLWRPASLSLLSFSVVFCFPFTSPTYRSSPFLLYHPIFESASARVCACVLLDSRRVKMTRVCVRVCIVDSKAGWMC
ncbi:hypothetical protein K457DRAFT_643448 [Linnemannia elongata AG-77]|uniref:Uncharacterized protein n=1 Tax=Linnemannia elongata AG-77 TaxID=1314771 RepID=A0A197JS31_9FUNG|nr:hypothetical protein K457DRAFT_643448 [Linnemannia elongata AG-77]